MRVILLFGVFALMVHLPACSVRQGLFDRNSLELQHTTERWDNGAVRTEYSTYRAEGSEILHGSLKSYNRNGSLYLEEEYVHGVLEGKRILYDEKGRTKLIEYYQNGHLHGITTVYEFGRKVREAEFRGGVLRGATRWDREGRIRVQFENDSEGRIVEGTSFDQQGNVTGQVENGTGRLAIPLGDQQVTVFVTFENGEKVSEELAGETGEDFDFSEPITPFAED